MWVIHWLSGQTLTFSLFVSLQLRLRGTWRKAAAATAAGEPALTNCPRTRGLDSASRFRLPYRTCLGAPSASVNLHQYRI